jgi:hypothetical protein
MLMDSRCTGRSYSRGRSVAEVVGWIAFVRIIGGRIRDSLSREFAMHSLLQHLDNVR